MLKRMLCIALAALMLTVVLAACGEPDAPETPTAAPTAAPTEAPADATPDQADTIDLKGFIKAFDRSGSVEEQTVYDADGVTAAVTGIRYDTITGAVLQFRVKNTTDKDILVQSDTAAVNDWMIPVDFSLKVGAGKSADGEMTLPYTSLALADIRVIATVEFSLRFADAVSYEVTAASEPIVIETSAAADYEPAVDADGQVVYDDKDIRIVLKGLDDRRFFSDSVVLLVYLYNGSDRGVCFQTSEVRVSGYEMTSAMNATLDPGKHAVDIIPIFDMDLEEHAIDEIDAVEVSFKLIDESTWDVIAQTELIMAEL